METTHDDATVLPRLGHYEIDTGRSTIRFRTRHVFDLLPVRGSFAVSAGTVDVAEPVTDTRVTAEIDAASFRTGNAMRDGTVRSAQYLDTDHYPRITFVSDRADASALHGILTVRDVSGPVRLTIEQVSVGPREFTAVATTRIDRTAFGVTAQRGMTGRYLDLTVEVTCRRV